MVTRPEKGALWSQGQAILKYQRVKFRSDKFPSLKRIQRFLEYEQATDVEIIDVRKYTQNTPFTTAMCATGFSARHISRIAYSLLKALKEAEVPDHQYFQVSGLRDSGWMLIILKDVYVHIFTEEGRKEVNLKEIYETEMTEEEKEQMLLERFEMYHRFKKKR